MVRLDSPFVDLKVRRQRVSGSYLVLEQAWEGIEWGQTSPRIHVELCDFRPEVKRWQDRRQGVWVESHAQFKVVGAD